MIAISNVFIEYKTESALNLALFGIKMADKLNDRKAFADCHRLAGQGFFIWGNFTPAIEYLNKALHLHDSLLDDKGLAQDLSTLGALYAASNDFNTGIRYDGEAKFLYEKIKDSVGLAGCIISMASNYMMLNLIDSTEKYLDIAALYYKKTLNTQQKASFLCIQAQLALKDKQFVFASEALKSAYAMRKNLPPGAMSHILYILAEVKMMEHKYDSAIIIAKEGLEYGYNNADPISLEYLEQFISDQYWKMNFKDGTKKFADSAYVYLKLASIAKDSLFNKNSSSKFNELTKTESLREIEKRRTEAETLKQNKLNAENIGIGSIIFLLATSIMAFSNRPWAKRSIMKVTGVITILLIFEFVTLKIHGWLEHITDHSPVFMILSLSAIAFILARLHHYFDHWFETSYLPKKEKEKLIKAQSRLKQIQANVEGDTKLSNATFSMKNESPSFIKRSAARNMRIKILTILNAGPTIVYLDWSGVDAISDAYAEELLGKLFKTVGQAKYQKNVVNKNESLAVNKSIEKVINPSS